jgi:hypothetical protein
MGRNAHKILGEERSQPSGKKRYQNPGEKPTIAREKLPKPWRKRSQIVIFFSVNILCTFGVSSVTSRKTLTGFDNNVFVFLYMFSVAIKVYSKH